MTENKLFRFFLSHFRNFPVTLGIMWLFTFLFTFSLNSSPEDGLGLILFFLFFYGSGSFLIESLFLQKTHSLSFFIWMGCNLVPSILLVFLSKTVTYKYYDNYFFRFCVCYFLIALFLGIYFCQKKLVCPFSEYLVRVFGRTIRYHTIWFVLMIGAGTITTILTGLFRLDYDIIMYTQALLFGLYFMSSFLLSLYPEKTEDSLFTAVLIKYIFTSMIAATYLIIYIYMLKILILWEIPSNAIFRITAGLFLVTVPVCIMNVFYRENHLFFRTLRWLPALFLPFLPLQAYSIGVRIYENGITPLRYAAVAFLLSECLALFLYYFRPARLHLLLIATVIFIFVCGCMPFINMSSLSFLNQKQAVVRYLSLPESKRRAVAAARREPQQTDNDSYQKLADRVYGAYSYLQYDYYGSVYLDSLTDADKSSLDELALDHDGYNSPINYHGGISPSAAIDVEGYRFCYPLDIWESIREPQDESANEEPQLSLSSYPILPAEQPELTVDLIKLFDFYKEQADEEHSIQSFLKAHNLWELDSTHTLWLQELSFNYEQTTDSYTYFHVSGYLLVK